MNIGDTVKMTECHKIPELIGLSAKIIAMVAQELVPHPITVELKSGDHAGKFCGFREDELEAIEPNHNIPDVFLSAA